VAKAKNTPDLITPTLRSGLLKPKIKGF